LVRVSRHDRLQAEIKVEYIPPDVLAEATSWELDLWFHLPSAVGIGAGQTPPETIYQDLRTFSRLKTPTVTLADLADLAGVGSPIATLAVLAEAADAARPTWQRDVRREARLTPRMLRSAARRCLAETAAEPATADRQMDSLLHATSIIGPRFRDLLSRLRQRPLDDPTSLCLEACDEYLSIQLELIATRAVNLLDELGVDAPRRAAFVALARREAAYRTRRGWRSSLPAEGDTASEEAFLDQVGLLKRYVERVLHLQPVENAAHRRARNSILGLAAALAMTWAVGLQVFAMFAFGLNLTQGAGTSIVAMFSMVAVLGYILKDRLKAWSAETLARQLPRFLDDRGVHLVWGIHAVRLAKASERLTFEAVGDLPPEVRARNIAALRSRLSAEVHDDVLHYRRRMVLHPRVAGSEFPRFIGVDDIIRINVARWVRTLAAPRRSIVVLSDGGQPVIRKLANRYSVPVVARLRMSRDGAEPLDLWSVHRLLLTQRGLERVETLDPPERPMVNAPPGGFL